MPVYCFEKGNKVLFLMNIYKRMNWKLYLFDKETHILTEGQSFHDNLKPHSCRFDGKNFRYEYYDTRDYVYCVCISKAPNFTALEGKYAEENGGLRQKTLRNFVLENSVGFSRKMDERKFTMFDRNFDFSNEKFVCKPPL